MDWERAKTQMIYVFIILNIFLGAMLYIRNRDSVKDFDVAEILNKNNITIDAKIPKPAKYRGRELEYKVFTKEEIIELFFDVPRNEGNDELRVFFEDKKMLSLIQGKTLKYTDEPKGEDIINSIEEAIDFANAFLKDKLSNIDYKLTRSEIKYDKFTLEYEQYDKKTGLILEDAYINLQLNNKGITNLDMKIFNSINALDNKLSMSDPKRKLLKIINMPGVDGRTITDVEICYSFDPKNIPYVNNPDKVLSGVASLALRLRLDNGLVIIIE